MEEKETVAPKRNQDDQRLKGRHPRRGHVLRCSDFFGLQRVCIAASTDKSALHTVPYAMPAKTKESADKAPVLKGQEGTLFLWCESGPAGR